MILLVSTSARGKDYAAALERGTGQKTHLVSSVPGATAKLRAAEYDVLAIDQSLLEADFRALDTLLNHAGMAMPMYLNLAVHSCERVVREAQVALQRGEKEKSTALRTAERVVGNQVRGELTGILLSSELALKQQSLPPEVAEKIQSVRQLAEKMRSRLGVSG